MQVRLVQLDAFADKPFTGNPAAVMPLPSWPNDGLLQALAAENNLSETAFLVETLPPEAGAAPERLTWHLRWFTPATEVDLCGHATLASAGVLFADHPEADRLAFWTRSGWLAVHRVEPNAAVLDFPADRPELVEWDADVAAAVGVEPVEVRHATDLIWVVADAETVRHMRPDLRAMAALPVRGVAVTAPSDLPGVDFVSRWFGGSAGVAEDPVTGSAHSQLAPYWASRLGRTTLTARQLSPRGGTVRCEVAGDRVLLTGTWHRYLDGVVELPDSAFSADPA